MVKANAYGHGAIEVSRTLLAEGVELLAVATIDEGIALRRAGVDGADRRAVGAGPPRGGPGRRA